MNTLKSKAIFGLPLVFGSLLLYPGCGSCAVNVDATTGSTRSLNEFAWRESLLEGRRQQTLQHLSVAQSCFESALKAARRSHAQDGDIVTCLRALAEVQFQQDIAEDANANYKRALSILKKNPRENFVLLSETYANLADIAYFDGDFIRARKLYESSLKVLADYNQRETLLYAGIEHRLGKCLNKLNLFKDASDVYYDTILGLMRQQALPDHNLLIDTIADYSDLFRNTTDQGNMRDASFQKRLLKDEPDALANGKGVAPSSFSAAVTTVLAERAIAASLTNHSQTNNTNTTINNSTTAPLNLSALPGSAIAVDRKLHDPALDQQVVQQRVDFYERMVSIDIKALGPNHPSVARDLSSLATVHLAQNNFAEAKPLLQRALVIYESTYGPKSSLTERTRTLIGVISEEERALQYGAPPSNEFLTGLPPVPTAAQTPEVALRLNYLALQCFSFGKTQEAQQLYAFALAATARVAGDSGMLTACCLNDYAHVLRALDQTQNATRYENDAAAIVRANIVKKAAAKNI